MLRQEEGCSRAPDDVSSLGSKDTDVILESMTYVGGLNYPKYRRDASPAFGPKAFGKHNRTVMLGSEAKRVLARLPDTRAECSEQHKIITAALKTMRCSVEGCAVSRIGCHGVSLGRNEGLISSARTVYGSTS